MSHQIAPDGPVNSDDFKIKKWTSWTLKAGLKTNSSSKQNKTLLQIFWDESWTFLINTADRTHFLWSDVFDGSPRPTSALPDCENELKIKIADRLQGFLWRGCQVTAFWRVSKWKKKKNPAVMNYFHLRFKWNIMALQKITVSEAQKQPNHYA